MRQEKGLLTETLVEVLIKIRTSYNILQELIRHLVESPSARFYHSRPWADGLEILFEEPLSRALFKKNAFTKMIRSSNTGFNDTVLKNPPSTQNTSMFTSTQSTFTHS